MTKETPEARDARKAAKKLQRVATREAPSVATPSTISVPDDMPQPDVEETEEARAARKAAKRLRKQAEAAAAAAAAAAATAAAAAAAAAEAEAALTNGAKEDLYHFSCLSFDVEYFFF